MSDDIVEYLPSLRAAKVVCKALLRQIATLRTERDALAEQLAVANAMCDAYEIWQEAKDAAQHRWDSAPGWPYPSLPADTPELLAEDRAKERLDGAYAAHRASVDRGAKP